MKKTGALAYIRQLCCLGLSREIVMAELLRAVQTVIPSAGNSLMGVERNGNPCHFLPEIVIPEQLDILMEDAGRFFSTEWRKGVFPWVERNGVLCGADAWHGFYSSDLYNLVLRLGDQHHVLIGLLRDNGIPVAIFSLYRSRYSPAFSEADRKLLNYLLPYLEHAYRNRNSTETEYVADGESGMFVVDNHGTVIFASETARRLLVLARFPFYPVGQGQRVRDVTMPPALGQLCRNLDGIFRGRDAPPPTLTHENPRGRFVFRAHWLDPLNREPSGLIGVTVEHREPVVLHLLRGAKKLPLSPMQREVCLLLAQNHTQESVARHLHIKLTTAKDHIRKIYRKLGIHQREELAGRLIAQAESP
jgi:DNA-binding CsgD family transcriptional regulator